MTTAAYQPTEFVPYEERFVLTEQTASAVGPGSPAYERKVQAMKGEFHEELKRRFVALTQQ